MGRQSQLRSAIPLAEFVFMKKFPYFFLAALLLILTAIGTFVWLFLSGDSLVIKNSTLLDHNISGFYVNDRLVDIGPLQYPFVLKPSAGNRDGHSVWGGVNVFERRAVVELQFSNKTNNAEKLQCVYFRHSIIHCSVELYLTPHGLVCGVCSSDF